MFSSGRMQYCLSDGKGRTRFIARVAGAWLLLYRREELHKLPMKCVRFERLFAAKDALLVQRSGLRYSLIDGPTDSVQDFCARGRIVRFDGELGSTARDEEGRVYHFGSWQVISNLPPGLCPHDLIYTGLSAQNHNLGSLTIEDIDAHRLSEHRSKI